MLPAMDDVAAQYYAHYHDNRHHDNQQQQQQQLGVYSDWAMTSSSRQHPQDGNTDQNCK